MGAGTLKIVGILQARMGSTRLPGKVLADLCGRPMLAWIVGHLRQAQRLNQLVIATSDRPGDDPIARLAADSTVACFRGHPTDCLDRYYQAAQTYGADVVVRLTADNPFVTGFFVDDTIAQFLAAAPPVDLLATSLCRAFPVGLCVEVLPAAALARAWAECGDPVVREHVTTFLLQNPHRFRVAAPRHPARACGHLRWTVDEPADLAFARAVYARLPNRAAFAWEDVAALIEREPELLAVNRHVVQRVIAAP